MKKNFKHVYLQKTYNVTNTIQNLTKQNPVYRESGTLSSRVPNGRLLSNLGVPVGRSNSGVFVVGAEISLYSSSSTFIASAAVDASI